MRRECDGLDSACTCAAEAVPCTVSISSLLDLSQTSLFEKMQVHRSHSEVCTHLVTRSFGYLNTETSPGLMLLGVCHQERPAKGQSQQFWHMDIFVQATQFELLCAAPDHWHTFGSPTSVSIISRSDSNREVLCLVPDAPRLLFPLEAVPATNHVPSS